jgi:hypothetical protein
MCNIKRKILKTVDGKKGVDKKYLESVIKCRNALTSIEWL